MVGVPVSDLMYFPCCSPAEDFAADRAPEAGRWQAAETMGRHRKAGDSIGDIGLFVNMNRQGR